MKAFEIGAFSTSKIFPFIVDCEKLITLINRKDMKSRYDLKRIVTKLCVDYCFSVNMVSVGFGLEKTELPATKTLAPHSSSF